MQYWTPAHQRLARRFVEGIALFDPALPDFDKLINSVRRRWTLEHATLHAIRCRLAVLAARLSQDRVFVADRLES